MKQEHMTDEEIADVFWDHLKRVAGHKDRRWTAWGSKTKVGLAATIQRLGNAREVTT
jgi:hypothetical protein